MKKKVGCTKMTKNKNILKPRKCVIHPCTKEYYQTGKTLVTAIKIHVLDQHRANLYFLPDSDVLEMLEDVEL